MVVNENNPNVGHLPAAPNGGRKDQVPERRPVHPNRVHRPAAQSARRDSDVLVVPAPERLARAGGAVPAAPQADLEPRAPAADQSAQFCAGPALRGEETHARRLPAARSDDAGAVEALTDDSTGEVLIEVYPLP